MPARQDLRHERLPSGLRARGSPKVLHRDQWEKIDILGVRKDNGRTCPRRSEMPGIKHTGSEDSSRVNRLQLQPGTVEKYVGAYPSPFGAAVGSLLI